MSLLALRVEGVRNLHTQEFDFSDKLNVVFGPNASGKTSLLEAINLLGTAKSFRTSRIDHVVQMDADKLQVTGPVRSTISARQLGVQRSAGKTRIRIAGETVSKASLLAHEFPVQVITPSSHALLEQGPKFRRKFLDWGLFHVEPKYHQSWLIYYRGLRQRNAVLRSRAPRQEIVQWDMGLAEAGEHVNELRTTYLNAFVPVFRHYATDLLGEDIEVSLNSGWKSGLSLKSALEAGLEGDRQQGFTRVGPHRGDLVFRLAGSLAQSRLSRGQQKLLVAALRLAQIDHLGQMTRRAGTLMVDDLAAELDREHRGRLLRRLRSCGAQVFVTVTEPELLDVSGWEQVAMFHVEHGKIREVL